MINKASVTILVDNFCHVSGLKAEHGLSLLLSLSTDDGDHQILLDAGQSGDVLADNLCTLGISLDNLRAVVLSHGHYDHTGGLLPFLNSLDRKMPVVVHPFLWGSRIKTKPYLRNIGATFTVSTLEAAGGEPIMADDPMPLIEDVRTSGTIGRPEASEKAQGFTRILDGKLIDDQLEDELALIVDLKEEGLLILTGCCHAGLINTIRHAMKITGNDRLKAIIGGFHLTGASEERLEKSLKFLKEANPEIVAPLHCTGRRESCLLSQVLGETVILTGAGGVITIR